jgi:aldose 1-epimerase
VSASNGEQFSISRAERAGQEVVMLRDLEVGSEAILVPGLGFACIAFRVPTGDDHWSVLMEPRDDQWPLARISGFGIPILFPWPNRIRGGRFSFRGREYQLPLTPGAPHASHGYVRERPWTVGQSGVDAAGAFCRASITLGNRPDDPWPFPCRLTFEYRLRGTTLGMIASVENVGSTPMPMGLGIHPWFGLPFGSDTARGAIEVRAPAARFWELDETFCTTGPTRPVADGFDARDWQPLADRLVDDVYTDLPLQDGWFTAEIRDPGNGRAVAVRSDGAFREHVVFAPLHLDIVCLEPYTCATDAFNLTARGLDAGTIVLDPGQSWRGEMAIEVNV